MARSFPILRFSANAAAPCLGPIPIPRAERAKFVLAYEEGLYSTAEFCQRFGVSRQTGCSKSTPSGHKWLGRYREEGLSALADRSRAPKHCPHQTPHEIEALLLACRQKHPRWGPKKLLAYLQRRHPDGAFPAPSTVGALLKRHGLTQPRRGRQSA